MIKLIRVTCIISMLALMLSVGTTAFAAEDYQVNENNIREDLIIENVGVTTEVPKVDSGFSILSTSLPRDTYNIAKNGDMSFSGEADITDLYTNKYFTGVKNPRIVVKNYSKSTLTVRLYKKNGWSNMKTWKVGGGNTLYAFTTDVSASGSYYLKFEAPSNFSGRVEK